MDKSKLGGWLIMLGSLVILGLFCWGLYLHHFWALAAPILAALLGVVVLGFWIGYTMAVTEVEEAAPPLPEEEKAPTSSDTPS